MASHALQIAKLLEKISSAIPVAGSIPAAIFGSAVVLLENAKSIQEDDDGFWELAISAANISLAVDEVMQGSKHSLPISVNHELEGIRLLFEDINHYHQKFSRMSRSEKVLKRSKYTKKWTNLQSQLNSKYQTLSLLSTISTAQSLSMLQHSLHATSGNMIDLRERLLPNLEVNVRSIADSVSSIFTSMGALALSSEALSVGEIQVNRTLMAIQTQLSSSRMASHSLDDDGLRIFSRRDMERTGPVIIDNRDSPKRLQLSQSGAMNLYIPEEFSTIVYVARCGGSVYVVKEYVGLNTEELRKRNEQELLFRIHTRLALGLHIVGTVGRNGISPCQVYSATEPGNYFPFIDFLKERAQDLHSADAIRAVLSLRSTIMNWNALSDEVGFSFRESSWDDVTAIRTILSNTIIHVIGCQGRETLTLVYAGDLYPVKERYTIRADEWSTWLRHLLPHRSLAKRVISSSPFHDHRHSLSYLEELPLGLEQLDLVPLLLKAGLIIPEQKVVFGYPLALGDVSFETERKEFFVLNSILSSIPSSHSIDVSVNQRGNRLPSRVGGRRDVCSFKLVSVVRYCQDVAVPNRAIQHNETAQ